MAERTERTLAATIRAASRALAERSETAALDARLLAAEAFALDPAGLILAADTIVEAERSGRFEALLARRLAGEPVHRILGRRAFRDHDFKLTDETLEPRPDTEVLVDLAARAFAAEGERDLLFADVGTGSGAIAVSLLALFPRACCLAVDLSPGALRAARANAMAAGVADRFLPAAADYLAAFGGPVDAIVSNPPYIPTAEIDRLAVEVREHDPRLALDGGADGLAAYRALARDAARIGARRVLLEIGAGQEGDVAAIFEAAGYRLVEGARDLGGHVRALQLDA